MKQKKYKKLVSMTQEQRKFLQGLADKQGLGMNAAILVLINEKMQKK